MTIPYPRPLPVLALLAALTLPAVGLGFCPDLWDTAESCVCVVGDELGVLIDCEVKKVARRAAKACDAFVGVRTHARDQRDREYFRALQKAVKRLRRTVRVAERKGLDIEPLRNSTEALRIATRKMIEDGIETLKARPDFQTNDLVVRAAARAGVCLDAARDALAGNRPLVTSIAEYRKAFEAMAAFR